MFQGRFRRLVLLGLAAVAIAAIAPAMAGAANKNKDVVCYTDPVVGFGVVTGVVQHDVIVPPNQVCDINNASVGHDVILQHDSYVGIASTTVGHDVTGTQVSTLETGTIDPGSGPVYIGHDLVLTGKQNNTNFANGATICDTTIGHDLVITGTATPFGTDIGDAGPQRNEFCTFAGLIPYDTVGHDLVIANNVFGRLDVGNNQIRHDMTIVNNSTDTSSGDVGDIDISDNQVGHDATCSGNSPAQTRDGPEDGPNSAGKRNTCG